MRDGGCLCGYVRYAVTAKPIDAGYCHCSLCQRSSGAPTLAWLTVAASGFRYLAGQASVYHSSPEHQREFCPRCGTQILFRAQQNPVTVDVTLASLDHPEAIPPEYHIWCDSRIDWLKINDDLPRYSDAGPDTE